MGDGVANAPHRTASTDDDVDRRRRRRIRHLLGYLGPSKPKAGVVYVLRGGRGDGLATFGQQGTTGSLLLLIAPGIGARYEF